MKTIINVQVNSIAKRLLLQKKELTGRSMSELTEFAIFNMPHIPSKKLKESLIRKDE